MMDVTETTVAEPLKGEALDEAVATQLLGLRHWSYGEGGYGYWCASEHAEPFHPCRECEKLRPYSLDMGVAWDLVHTVQPRFWVRLVVGSRAVNGVGVADPEPWADVEVGSYPTGQHSSRTLARESGPLDDVPAMITRALLTAHEASSPTTRAEEIGGGAR